MPCTIHIRGKEFDTDDFVAKTGLENWSKGYKGQPRRKSNPEGEKLAFSYLSMSTSEAEFDDLPIQIADTILFLKENEEALSQIATTAGVEEATLDFGINLRMGRNNIALQSDRFPAELLKLAGNLGIDIVVSLYPD